MSSTFDHVGDVVVGLDEGGVQEALEGPHELVVPQVVHLAHLVEVLGRTHQCEVKGQSLRDIVIPVDHHGCEIAFLLCSNNMNILSTIQYASRLYP